jgi:single-strand DNA-binding protein
MGADVNAVTLVGRLTRDPEVRGNGSVLAMRLAFTATRKAGDEWEDVAQYVDVVTFRAVDALSRLLAKGDQIAVNGRLSWREWEANDGSKRQSHEVVADRVQLLAKPRDKQEGSTPPPAKRDPVADAPPPPLPINDDIPF